MSPELIGILGLAFMFILMAIGMPIGFVMALAGFAGASAILGFTPAATYMAQIPYSSVASYDFSVIPLFVLMGNFAFFSGMTEDGYRVARNWLGKLPGGLAMATIAGCTAFAAICGSSLASAMTMAKVAHPEMTRYKYDARLSLGSIAAGGTLGILIPPSVPMMVYGIYAEQSIGKLFMAGFIPGFLFAFMFCVTIFLWVKRSPSIAPSPEFKITWKERVTSLKYFWAILILVLIVMGGIWGGIITANEAGGIGALGAFIIALARRKLSSKNAKTAMMDSVKVTAMIFTIIIGAMIFTVFMAQSRLPLTLSSFVGGLGLGKTGVIIIILFVYLLLGCVMDTLAMTLLTLPIFLPMLRTLGVDLIWFGIALVVMTELAMVTPPVGMNVFVLAGTVRDVPMQVIFRGVTPFIFTLVLGMALLVAFPQIAVWLPQTMMK
jgi:C4-dicarboxylate transporter, DctM subunit